MNNDNPAVDSKLSQVAGKADIKQKIAISILLVVMVFVLILMFHGSKKTVAPRQQESVIATQHDNIVKQNAAYLKSLQTMKQASAFTELLSTKSGESKEMKLRRNAPTQVFSTGAHVLPKVASKGSEESDLLADNSDPYSRFANSQNKSESSVSATKIAHPEKTIAQGELIHAVLETAINSDLPGMVRAVVTEPVYSYVGSDVLLPKGSRLVGQYASLAGNGSATNRVYIMWNRVITPKGTSVMINSPSSDGLGTSGQGADSIDSHFWHVFGNATLMSIIGAGTANLGVTPGDQPNSSDAYRGAIADSFQQTAGKMLSQNMNIAPTLHINQGARINVFVAKDIDMGSL